MKRIIIILTVLTTLTGFSIISSASQDDISKFRDAFDENGCSGCHIIGKDYNGPDLTGITEARSKKWIIDFIMNPQKYYNDPEVRALIRAFNLYMPNQGVTKEDAELIYRYLKYINRKNSK